MSGYPSRDLRAVPGRQPDHRHRHPETLPPQGPHQTVSIWICRTSNFLDKDTTEDFIMTNLQPSARSEVEFISILYFWFSLKL